VVAIQTFSTLLFFISTVYWHLRGMEGLGHLVIAAILCGMLAADIINEVQLGSEELMPRLLSLDSSQVSGFVAVGALFPFVGVALNVESALPIAGAYGVAVLASLIWRRAISLPKN